MQCKHTGRGMSRHTNPMAWAERLSARLKRRYKYRLGTIVRIRKGTHWAETIGEDEIGVITSRAHGEYKVTWSKSGACAWFSDKAIRQLDEIEVIK